MAINDQELRDIISQDKANTELASPELTPAGQEPITITPAVEAIPLPQIINESTETLTKILDTQQKVNKVKEDLNVIVDAIAKNPSMLSRAANAWGELPLWLKIGGGVLVVGPTLALGIVFHGPVLLAVTGVSAVAYAGGGIVLDDHYSNQKIVTDQIKQGVIGLTDLLGIIITALEKLHTQLKEEVEKFTMQNVKLTDNVANLEKEVQFLQENAKIFIQTQKLLSETEERLKATANELSTESEKLNAVNKELFEVRKAFAVCQVELEDTLGKLKTTSAELDKQIETATTNNDVLLGALKKMSESSKVDAQTRENLNTQMADYLKNRETILAAVIEQNRKSTTELARVNQQLEIATEKNEKLVAENRKLNTEMKELVVLLSDNVEKTGAQSDKLCNLAKDLEEKVANAGKTDINALLRHSFLPKPKSTATSSVSPVVTHLAVPGAG